MSTSNMTDTAPTTPLVNGHVPDDSKSTGNATTTDASPQQPAKKRPPKRKGPNYAHIHRKPLPLDVHPLPVFHPTNPISLLQLAYTFLSQLLSPPTSHPASLYTGYFHLESRSVHVTDPEHIRALWEMGFYGKGLLSRSEPSWLEREQARLKTKRGGGGTAEEATRKRREERRAFKLERARAEAEKIERQRAVEEGRLPPEENEAESGDTEADAGAGAELADEAAAETREAGRTNGSIEKTAEQAEITASKEGRVPDAELVASDVPEILVTCDKGTDVTPSDLVHGQGEESDEPPAATRNEEHLQLTPEEAFFLSYGLGVLSVQSPSDDGSIGLASKPAFTNRDLLAFFAAHATFPPTPPLSSHLDLNPANQFVLNYVVYHHFRSLGWVVRPGTKFSCDFLLYIRGPVFSHAEFAVIILPSYSHPFWSTDEGVDARKGTEGVGGRQGMDWWWLHCINRVQSQVKKTLVLCYVEVPPPLRHAGDGDESVTGQLKRYKVREFVMRRWLMNRSRD